MKYLLKYTLFTSFALCAAGAASALPNPTRTSPVIWTFPADGQACYDAAQNCQPGVAYLNPYCAALGNNSQAIGGWCDPGRELGGSIQVICQGTPPGAPNVVMECKWGDGGRDMGNGNEKVEKTPSAPIPPGPVGATTR